MKDTDWVEECEVRLNNFEGADMIPTGDDQWICDGCLITCADEPKREINA